MYGGECEPWNYLYCERFDDRVEYWTLDPGGVPASKFGERYYDDDPGLDSTWLDDLIDFFAYTPYVCRDCHFLFTSWEAIRDHAWPYKDEY